MSETFIYVNLDKEQYLDPKHFANGPTLPEVAESGGGILLGLSLLLTSSGEVNQPPVGTWVGDRVVLAGDQAADAALVNALPNIQRRVAKAPVKQLRAIGYYPKGSDLPDLQFFEHVTLHTIARLLFKNVSYDILRTVVVNDPSHRLARVDPTTGTLEGADHEQAIADAVERLKNTLRVGDRSDAIVDMMQLRAALDVRDYAGKL